jgi:four helix bundle protein
MSLASPRLHCVRRRSLFQIRRTRVIRGQVRFLLFLTLATCATTRSMEDPCGARNRGASDDLWGELLRQETPNPNGQIPNSESNSSPQMEQSSKQRDLEERTFRFAESVRGFVKQLPKTISNVEDIRQLVRASGSVAANWIEADEALSRKDFLMRVKICRKEAKESRLFLRLVDTGLTGSTTSARDKLGEEARELTLIFSSIISKVE